MIKTLGIATAMNLSALSTQLQQGYLKPGDRNFQGIDLPSHLTHWGGYKGLLDSIFNQDVAFGDFAFSVSIFPKRR